MSRKKQQPRGKKHTKSRPGGSKELPILQYYHLVFEDLFDRLHQTLEHALLNEPKERRASFWLKYRAQTLCDNDAWDALSDYASQLQDAMAAIVSAHSVYYWLHLYRRIGVSLHAGHEQKTDPITTGLVRLVVESAFSRFGRLHEETKDICLSSEIQPEELMGGMWLRLHREHLPPTHAEFLFNDLKTSPQWVLVSFSEDDFANLFRVEGLAYEYWLTTARLRAVGKGSSLRISSAGDPTSVRSPELEWLLRSYDVRTAKQPAQSSAIGVGFGGAGSPHKLVTMFAQYNIKKLPLKAVHPPARWVKLAPNLITNFVYTSVDVGSYMANHAFADDDFRNARGFSLSNLCVYLSAIVFLEFSQVKGSPRDQLLGYGQLYQRAYTVTPADSYFDALKKTARGLAVQWFGTSETSFDKDADAIAEFLTLRAQKQSTVGLWSFGPRFAFLPHGKALVVDLHELGIVLKNAFFRVKYNQGAKGPGFEEHVRQRLGASGLEVLPERHLKNERGHRETDVAVRVGATLFLCECKAMEMPLDFEIGRPKTVASRRQYFESYVNQALSLEEFVRSSITGKNYDFSWANRVTSVVVSPFVEWVWSREDALWLTEAIPRILSVEEAIEFMKAGGA